MKLSSIKRDTAAITAGEWVGDIPNMGNLRLRVRGLSSPVVSALRGRKERAATKADRSRDGALKPDAALRVMGEVLAEVVLIDWDGVLDDNGKPLKYDAKRAHDLCTNPDWVEFANAVVFAATVVDNGGDKPDADNDADVEGN